MSAPPVRIESKAWTDLRYRTLALHLGLPCAEFALIQMATIWRWQTEHFTDAEPTYAVSAAVVVGALGLKGPEAIIASDLAERDPDGRFRIRGGMDDSGRSRIDWLWNGRQDKREKAAKRLRQVDQDGRGKSGRFQPATSRAPAGDQPSTSTAPPEDQPATSSPFSVLRSPDPDLSHPATEALAKVEPVQPPPAAPPTPPRVVTDKLLRLAEVALRARWHAETKLHAELGASTPPPAIGTTAPVEAHAIRVVQGWMLEAPDGGDPAVTVDERLTHLLAVRSAVARSTRSLKFWAPSTFWDPDGIAKDLRQTADQAVAGLARGRDSPRGRQPANPAANEIGPDGYKRNMPPLLRPRRAVP